MQNKIKSANYNELQDIGIQISMSNIDRDDKERLYVLIDERLEYLDSGGALVEYTPLDDFQLN